MLRRLAPERHVSLRVLNGVATALELDEPGIAATTVFLELHLVVVAVVDAAVGRKCLVFFLFLLAAATTRVVFKWRDVLEEL